MDKLASMRIFCKVIECGSFVGAAKAMDISTAVVTRAVADLERHLGTRLIYRTTRTLSLTAPGEVYLHRSQSILDEIDESESAVIAAGNSYSGVLKISVTVNFGLQLLPGIIARFRSKYPQVTFDALLVDDAIDLVAHGRDLGVMFAGGVVHLDTVVRPLTETKMVLCATRTYLDKHPPLEQPADLSAHQCICLSANQENNHVWILQGRKGETTRLVMKPLILCSTAAFARECVLADLGVGMFTSFIASRDIQTGRIVRVLEDYALPDRKLVLAYPSRMYVTPVKRAFMDFLAQEVSVNGQGIT